MWRTKLSTGGFINIASSGDVAVLVQGDVIVAGCMGHAWGIDAKTGEVLWHNSLTGLGNGFVSLADGSSSVQYIHVTSTSHSHSSS